MSIAAMADVAIARRARRPQRFPQSAEATAASAGTTTQTPAAAAGTAVTGALKLITTYIPTEILALYVSAIAVFISRPENQSVNLEAAWQTFFSFLLATPMVVWLVYAAKLRGDNNPLPVALAQWPKWEMLASTVAFVAWAAALPQTPFGQFSWYSSDVAGFLVLVITTVLGLVTPMIRS